MTGQRAQEHANLNDLPEKSQVRKVVAWQMPLDTDTLAEIVATAVARVPETSRRL